MSETQCTGIKLDEKRKAHPCRRKAVTRTDGWPYCADCDPDKNRKLADAVRLAADAVVKAADAGYIAGIDEGCLKGLEDAGEYWMAELGRAVLAHRKAKAEQAKEARRG